MRRSTRVKNKQSSFSKCSTSETSAATEKCQAELVEKAEFKSTGVVVSSSNVSLETKLGSSLEPESSVQDLSKPSTMHQKARKINSTIDNLSQRVESLEGLVKYQTKLIEDLINGGSSKKEHHHFIDIGIQTDSPRPMSYAEAARRPKPSTADPHHKKVTESPRKSEKSSEKNKEHTFRTSDARPKKDVTTTMTSVSNEKEKEKLPSVVLFQDSVLRGVKHKRLGESYDFNSSFKRVYQVEDLEKEMKAVSSAPDAVVIHCGINNLKKDDPEKMSKCFVSSIKNICKSFSSTKVVISKLAPVKEEQLNMKRQLFNALVTKELFEEKKVSFVSHDQLNCSHLKDGVHPSFYGSSILAASLGRHLRRLLWSKPRKAARVPHQSGRWFHPQRPGPPPGHPRFFGAQDPRWNMYDVLQRWG